VKSVLGEFSSGVSICCNKHTRSDLGAPFLLGAPSSGSACDQRSENFKVFGFYNVPVKNEASFNKVLCTVTNTVVTCQ